MSKIYPGVLFVDESVFCEAYDKSISFTYYLLNILRIARRGNSETNSFTVSAFK